ncbi:hypothetical protein TIFTF001_042894 [Ficus carica]|uniref:Uncharacterized protein n=1 Tax=Ficus carica TaxID=3494 RepID=A0AA87YP37_FICCA|nr:hypothetical protein TIFTF001_042894 [Ficus carica]
MSKQKVGTHVKDHMMQVIAKATENGAELDCNTQIEMVFKTLSKDFVGFWAAYNFGGEANLAIARSPDFVGNKKNNSGAGIRCFAQLEGCSPCTGASTMDNRCSCSFDVSFDTLCGNTRHRGVSRTVTQQSIPVVNRLMVFSCSTIGGCVAPAMNALRIEALSALLLVFRGGVGCSMSGGFECRRL